MTLLIAGIVIFFGVHLIPPRPRLRAALCERLGETPYKAAFSLASFIGLGLMVLGMRQAEYLVVWRSPFAGADMVVAALMLPALVLLAASNLRCHIKRAVRSPMSLGMLLWSASHLAMSRDPTAALLFGAFALYAVYDIYVSTRRATAAATSPTSSSAPPPPPAWRFDALALLIGTAAFALLATFHETLFGIPVGF